ncbi:hypothetical protein IQ255_29250 [Pleurocapsales cyanobacterium LEGE 10410]|nr:hypothetical protein [Pleurocapsales cyanobacterium LEGE 10410]
MKHYRIKYWLYKQDQWIISTLVILLTVITTVALIDVSRNGEWIKVIEFRVWVAIIVGLITLLFAFMRQKHNDMSVFFQLFEKFNNRYDELNSYLNAINKITSDNDLLEQQPREHPFKVVGDHMNEKLRERLFNKNAVENVLDDYLNLCAEEHLAYINGYIPPNIMKYWYNGMEVFFKNENMREYFKEELDSDSYYEFKDFAIEKFDKIEANEA